jgi:hypothetical protein
VSRRFRAVRISVVAGLTVAGLGLAAPSASADFHLMKVREVYVSPANPNSQFVELQMYAAGQNFVGGHSVHFYAASGLNTPTETFSANVPNGENQATILIATAQAEAEFGVQADLEMTPKASSDFSPAGGAVCFENIDCVSWGSFSGSPASPTGAPAPAIPAGSSLTRSIAPNCGTLLEDADDTNDSLTDFSLASPSPRNNATPPTEVECPLVGGDTDPPNTTITKGPKDKTRNKQATFEFASTEPGSTFTCILDGKSTFKPCTSPFKVKVQKGKHTFQVQATDSAGNTDGSPATDGWKVRKRKKS